LNSSITNLESESNRLDKDREKLEELTRQVNHYQTLYQKRVEKDLAGNQEKEIQQLILNNQQLTENFQNFKTTAEEEKNELVNQGKQAKELYQQKVNDLETQLLNLAKRKVKNQKEAKQLITQLETNYKDKEQV
jgi:hypothetical protein